MASTNTTELRASLHRYIEQLDDRFLAVVHAMLGAYVGQQAEDPIVGYTVEGQPLYASVAKAEFKARLDAIDRGEYVTLEELEKESKTWLQEMEDTEL